MSGCDGSQYLVQALQTRIKLRKLPTSLSLVGDVAKLRDHARDTSVGVSQRIRGNLYACPGTIVPAQARFLPGDWSTVTKYAPYRPFRDWIPALVTVIGLKAWWLGHGIRRHWRP